MSIEDYHERAKELIKRTLAKEGIECRLQEGHIDKSLLDKDVNQSEKEGFNLYFDLALPLLFTSVLAGAGYLAVDYITPPEVGKVFNRIAMIQNYKHK